jgi:aminoglycoside phosphotransferase (APT) family kinase protein
VSGADGAPVLIPVLANHRFDEAALARYLATNLPDFAGPITVRQFQGGQSNPTFVVDTAHDRYVLRKQPPGHLLPSAHAVDREFRVMRALAGSAVPVPEMLLLCTDPGVIGTIFFVMRHVAGRVFVDRTLPAQSPAARGALYAEMGRILADLHAVDWRAAGLEGFGRPEGYVRRQVDRWARQYRASDVGDVPAMDSLIAWLAAHVPADDESAIAHGDFRLGNLIYAADAPRVAAVLDWELSTIGHPVADLAYSCLYWRLPPDLGGLRELDIPGLPSETEFVAEYCRRTGRASLPDFEFFVAFSLFRWAAIAAGVYRRALDGNAADAAGLQAGEKFQALAAIGWDVARRAA